MSRNFYVKLLDKLSDEALADQMKQYAIAIKGAIAGVAAKVKANPNTEKFWARTIPVQLCLIQILDFFTMTAAI